MASSPGQSAESKELERLQLVEIDKLKFRERQAKRARERAGAGRASLIKTSALGVTDETVAAPVSIAKRTGKPQTLKEFLQQQALARSPLLGKFGIDRIKGEAAKGKNMKLRENIRF